MGGGGVEWRWSGGGVRRREREVEWGGVVFVCVATVVVVGWVEGGVQGDLFDTWKKGKHGKKQWKFEQWKTSKNESEKRASFWCGVDRGRTSRISGAGETIR